MFVLVVALERFIFFNNTTSIYIFTLSLDFSLFFFFNDTATTEIYTLSLHDALPISRRGHVGVEEHDDPGVRAVDGPVVVGEAHHDEPRELAGSRVVEAQAALDDGGRPQRSEEHTSELQSPCNLVCRLLLEKKKTNIN